MFHAEASILGCHETLRARHWSMARRAGWGGVWMA